MKLGIGGKLAAGGAFGIGGAIGGGITTMAQNFTHGMKNGRGFLGSLRSAGAGAVSGMVAGGRAGFNAKNFADMRNAASTGATKATEKRDSREAYKASHGGTFGAIGGHFMDGLDSAKEWAGFNTSLDALKEEKSKVDTASSAREVVDDRLSSILEREKNERTLRHGSIAGVGGKTYTNYADLLNDIEIMKSTGEYVDAHGTTQKVTGADITAMARAESDMKKAMKKDILAGYDKSGIQDIDKMDGELKELITSYRTKVLQNFNEVQKNIEDTTTSEFRDFQKTIVDSQNESLADFITSGDITTSFDASKKVLGEAKTKVNVEVAQKIEKESKKNDKK